MSLALPRRARLARLPTPIERLPRFETWLGGPELWIKRDDLTGTALSGNKVRKLEYHLPAALAAGADTLVTCGGIQSNHARATAVVAARQGLACHLVLRGEPPAIPDGNLLLGLLAGAKVTWVTPEEYRDVASTFQRIAADLRSRGHTPHIVPEGASDALGTLGYLLAAREISREEGGRPFTHIVHACGSGGTAAGLAVGRTEHRLGAGVVAIAVCDDAPTFTARIETILEEVSARFGSPTGRIDPPTVLDEYVGDGYGLSSSAQRETMRHLARLEGIMLDPTYSGKAFHALVEECRRGRFGSGDRVLFVHTGGIFGLLAQAETFASS